MDEIVYSARAALKDVSGLDQPLVSTPARYIRLKNDYTLTQIDYMIMFSVQIDYVDA